ncbi:PREDICTED: coiled-coil domain-containing protein 122 [Gekko japonicus]|uniref:Coiled-coil domain-containing protein 122 n=1 Tax=Gekko japonicus TaxID=146911 RepID=A0ABM1LDE2_GEKJA|nr:PREDICTED: coiled-coil domain-containing protein 122 [Gekko japonicus]
MADPNSSSLAEAVKQVAQQQHSQASEVEKSKAILGQLQTQLQDFDTQINWFVTETKAVERQICHQEEAITATDNHCEALQMQIATLYAENLRLTFDIEALQEEFKMLLLRNEAYSENIRAHKCRFEEAESKWPLMVEVANKRAAVKDLIARKEELMSALQNPEGNAANSVRDEIACLESEINVLKEAVSQKQNTLQVEKNIQARLRKEIEVENKRCGAILKRLRCQVNKLQASQRQGRWNVWQMEGRVAELRKLLGVAD